MQFRVGHGAGDDKVFVVFNGNFLVFKDAPRKALISVFNRLGGQLNQNGEWIFPSFIAYKVLQETIRNTCFECGGLMKDSTAYINTEVSFDDFGNDAGSRGTTVSRVGPAKIIKVRKCSACGHSHT